MIVWLTIKKYWWILAGSIAGLVYMILRKDTRQVPPLEDPEPAEKIVAEDFLVKAIRRKVAIDEEIRNRSRKQFVDDVNDEYSKGGDPRPPEDSST